MLLRKIFLKDFFSHADTKIDFTKTEGVVLINGVNGAGKSSLIEAVFYALFNELRTNNIDDAIRHGQDSMYVVVEFELNGQIIQIARSKRRGKAQKLNLSIDGIEIEELSSELQKRIESIVKLSSESFRSSIFFKQEDGNFFASSKPEERQQILSDLLELNKYERLEKLARDNRTDVKNNIKAKQMSIQDMEDVNIEELEAMLGKLKKVCAKNDIHISELEEELQKITSFNSIVEAEEKNKQSIIRKNEQIDKRIETNNTTIKKNVNTIEQLKEEVQQSQVQDTKKLQKSLDTREQIIDELTNEYDALTNDINTKSKKFKDNHNEKVQSLKEDLAVAKANFDASNNQIKKITALKEANCPTCLRGISHEEKHEMIGNFETEAEDFNKVIEKIRNSIDEVNVILEKNLKTLHPLEELIDEKTAELQSAKKEYKTIQADLKLAVAEQQSHLEKENNIKSLTDKNNDLYEEIKFLQQQIEKVPNVKSSLKDDTELKNNLSEAKLNQRKALSLQIEKEKQIEISQGNEEKKTRILKDIGTLQSRLELLEQLVVSFGKSGIPNSIIANVLPNIEDTANQYLERLTDKDFQIKFSTTVENKKGDVKNTLDIFIESGGNSYNFNNLSGGEKFVISLALRLSLAKILTQRSNVQLETLILDEPSTSADLDTRQNFVSVIKSLKNIFPRIILTTHLQDIAESFDNRIVLGSNDDESE